MSLSLASGLAGASKVGPDSDNHAEGDAQYSVNVTRLCFTERWIYTVPVSGSVFSIFNYKKLHCQRNWCCLYNHGILE